MVILHAVCIHIHGHILICYIPTPVNRNYIRAPLKRYKQSQFSIHGNQFCHSKDSTEYIIYTKLFRIRTSSMADLRPTTVLLEQSRNNDGTTISIINYTSINLIPYRTIRFRKISERPSSSIETQGFEELSRISDLHFLSRRPANLPIMSNNCND